MLCYVSVALQTHSLTHRILFDQNTTVRVCLFFGGTRVWRIRKILLRHSLERECILELLLYFHLRAEVALIDVLCFCVRHHQSLFTPPAWVTFRFYFLLGFFVFNLFLSPVLWNTFNPFASRLHSSFSHQTTMVHFSWEVSGSSRFWAHLNFDH